MKLSQIIITLFISAAVLTETVANDANKLPNGDCSEGYFKAYTNPSNYSDSSYVCVYCNCGFGLCKDFLGCTSCSSRYFLQYKDARYSSRTYSVC